jgi:phospholipid/cholesterol/gamma-HCH transport system ATP-binding protein
MVNPLKKKKGKQDAAPFTGPAIELVQLKKTFGDHEVLKGIDLVIPTGSICVVLGGSGMGKSVMMKHMVGLIRPTSGQVIIDGGDISGLDDVKMKKVREKFGMVFQYSALFDSMTNFDNVAFPLREHRKLKGDELKKVVHEKLSLFSLDPEIVGPKFPSEISGGMRKRVALARAVALDPSIIFYDEPTTGLDPITTGQVDDMILQAKAKLGVTSVAISHDIDSAFNIADQLLFVYEGQIVVRGKKEDLLACEHPYVRNFFNAWDQR